MTEQRRFRLTDYVRPERLVQWSLRGPLGAVVASPMIDRPTLWAVAELYLPLSRLWAAAYAANGSVDSFMEQVPLRDPSRAMRARIENSLWAFDKARVLAEHADRKWRQMFFGSNSATERDLARAERRRMTAAQALVLQRLRFAYIRMRHDVPPVRFDIAGEAEVEAAYGALLERPEESFLPPADLPKVEVSRRFRTKVGEDYWLRFPSPSERVGNTAWARVHEPVGVSNPPTLIFGNGVLVEFDQLRYGVDDVAELCRQGVRLIEIEAPWHGRRLESGYYSGEPFLARAPVAAMDLFSAQVREIAVITDWCRSTSTGRVGVSGASMGALAAQLAGTHSRHWPERLRPDVLGLITFCDRVHELPFTSALAQKTGLSKAIADAGWTLEACHRWSGLTDATDDPAVAAKDIVAVLGTTDEVTPFDIGKRQVERWGVPERNLFIRRQGHFSVPVGLVRDDGPLRRIATLLKQDG